MTPRFGTRGGFLALLVLVPLVWLTPLAYASPPDQTWIGGFYDDADFDDVVLLATSLVLALGDIAPALAASMIVMSQLTEALPGRRAHRAR